MPTYPSKISIVPRLITLVALSGVVLPFTPLAAWSFPWDVDMYRGPAVQPLSRAPRNTWVRTRAHGGAASL